MPPETLTIWQRRYGPFFQNLATKFETAPRMGGSVDDPEGERYIQFSDTLALDIAQRIREALPE